MYRYQIQKGAENRVFANARNVGNGIVESDEELFSPYLTAIKEDVTNMVAEKPPADTPSTPVNQPSASVSQVPASAPQPKADKEASE